MRPCPAGRGGDGTALVIPCHVAFAGRQRGADLSKSRATPPPKRGSKKIWGQLWGHVIFSSMKKSFIFSMLLAYFVFPAPNKHFKKCAEVRKALSSADFFFLSCPGCAAGRRRHKLRLQTRAVWSVLPIGVRVEVIGGAQARLRHPVSVPCPGGGRCDSLQTGRRRGRARPQRRMPNRWTPVQHASAGPGCSMSAPCDSKAPALDELSHEASMCRQDRMHTSCTARWRP